jgi:hypothetical protein
MQSFIASIHGQECMTVVLSSETSDRSGNIKLAGKRVTTYRRRRRSVDQWHTLSFRKIGTPVTEKRGVCAAFHLAQREKSRFWRIFESAVAFQSVEISDFPELVRTGTSSEKMLALVLRRWVGYVASSVSAF